MTHDQGTALTMYYRVHEEVVMWDVRTAIRRKDLTRAIELLRAYGEFLEQRPEALTLLQ